jgi:hypothetical protein
VVSCAAAYQLHALAGRIAAARGDGARAGSEVAAAEREVARLSAELAPDERRAFEALAEVKDLVEPRDAG